METVRFNVRLLRQRGRTKPTKKKLRTLRKPLCKSCLINAFLQTMDTSERTDNQTHEAGQSFFPAAVSEEKLDESRRRSAFSGFSKRLLAAGERRGQRSDLQPGSIIVQSKAAEHYRKGKEAVEKSQYETAVVCFSKAIVLQPEQVELHVSQGEAYIQLCDFQSAAESYKRACFLEPGAHNSRLAFIYHLQGQCLFDRSLFLEALPAFRKAAELKPGDAAYRIRSPACLEAAGRHADCLKELSGLISESPTAELYAFRARVHRATNQTSHCVRDVKSALALDPTCREARALLLQLKEASEEARQQAALRMLSDRLQEALCLINAALESRPEDGRLYLFRGILYRRLKEFNSAIEDLVQAAELSEPEEEEEVREVKAESDSVQEEVRLQLALTYNDFAVQCFSRGLYAEATLLLNKAIKEEKSLAGLYLNRGDCFFKQGDWCYALLDYQQAEEMLSPAEPAVRLRLAVIYNTLGSFCFQDGRFQDAADMFTLAIKHNPTVSQYYENRSKALRRVQNLRGARSDFIRLLILDPDNEEVPPMLMNLFPGSTVSELLSSAKGRALRAELTETIRTWNSPSDPESLGENLKEMTVSERKPESESADLCAAARELSLCVNGKDLQKTAKALLQVVEAVESFVPDCPVLHHSSGTHHTSLCPAAPTTSPLPPSGDLSCLRSATQT